MKTNLRHFLISGAVGLVLLAGGCSERAVVETTPTATPLEATPTTLPAPATPTPPGGKLPPLAQVTPISTPGSDWATHTALGIQLAAPPAWQSAESGGLAGADGYARWSPLALDGAAPSAACITQANQDRPDAFGAYPEIRDMYRDGTLVGCLILPSNDQPAALQRDAMALLWLPDGNHPSLRLALHADRGHVEAIAATVQLAETAQVLTGACDYTVQGQAGRTITTNGLRISEYPAAASAEGSTCDPQSDPLAFNAAATSGEAATRTSQILDAQFGSARVAQLNQALAAFGVKIRTVERRFAIEQNGVKVHSNISWIGPLSLNASGSDFRLPLVDGYDNGTFMLSPVGLQRDEGWDILLFDRVFPVFVGDDLISAAYDYERYPRQVNDPALLNVTRNGQVISTWSVDGATADGGPARSLAGWDGHWVLELPGVLVEDGEMLNERLGYPEMFTWRMLNQRPLYFYRTDPAQDDGLVHIAYDGEALAEVTYDEVIHTALGGNAVLLRLKAYASGMFFYARRGGVWYYVTLQPVQ